MKTLLPCPCCNSDKAPGIDSKSIRIFENEEPVTHMAVCQIPKGGCGLAGPVFGTAAAAVAQWNVRPALTRAAVELHKLAQDLIKHEMHLATLTDASVAAQEIMQALSVRAAGILYRMDGCPGLPGDNDG